MTTILLFVIVFLQLLLLALMIFGRTAREKPEFEGSGEEVRRELAQHRADSLQFLHAMRIELEESLRETIDLKLDSLAVKSSFALKKSSEQRAPKRGNGSAGAAEEGVETCAEKSGSRSGEKEQQLELFSETSQTVEPECSFVRVYAADDLPDIE